MELPIYERRNGRLLFKFKFELSDTCAVIKDKIKEEEDIDADEQTLFISNDTTTPASPLVYLRLDESVLNKWLVRDVQKYKLFVELPTAADKVTVEGPERILIVGNANNKMTVKPLDCAAGPVSFQCVNNTLNILLDTEPDGVTHRVLQFKDERQGSFHVRQQGPELKVFYTSNEGIEDDQPLQPERVDLTQTRTLGEWGKHIFLLVCRNSGFRGIAVGARWLYQLYQLWSGELTFDRAMETLADLATAYDQRGDQPTLQQDAGAQHPAIQ